MTIIATGIDLAKSVFAVHGVNLGGAVLLRQPKVARAKLGAMISALPPSMIGVEGLGLSALAIVSRTAVCCRDGSSLLSSVKR